MIAGALVRYLTGVEAQILLDGAVIYGSRHPNQEIAAQELEVLRGRCEGWLETV